MNTYPSSTPSPPRPPPLVVPHALAARGPDPLGPMDLTSSREEVLSRTGLATISPVAAPSPRAATRISLWDRVGAFLGYAGRSEDERVQRQLVVRVIYAFAFTAAQFIVTVALTVDGMKARANVGPYEGQTEFEICRALGIINILWLARTVSVCLLIWLYPESVDSDETITICPLDFASFSALIAKIVMPATLGLCIGLSGVWLIHRGRTCRDYAPHIFALTTLILSVLILHYVLGCLIWYYTHRYRHSPASPHLTRAEVDRIALVHYISPSADEAMSPVSPASPTSPTGRSLHSPRSPVSYRKRPRFILFRSRSTAVGGDIERDAGDASWGRPEVRLPDNLARCAICLEDFEAPPGAVELPSESGGGGDGEALEMTRAPPRSVMEMRVRVEPETHHPEDLGVADTGGKGAPMPLRLLGCGHAFHKDCIDPWLMKQEAARCPNCRKHVQVPQPATKRWGSWRNATV